MTHLCVPIFVESVEQTKRDVAAAIEAGADMIELRADSFDDVDLLTHLLLTTHARFILTRRPVSEGGMNDGADVDRVRFLNECAVDQNRINDIELTTYRKFPHAGMRANWQRIISVHDFLGRPDRLYNLIDELNGSQGDINKIAWMARSIRDNIEAFEILLQRQKPTIALCMGEAGLLSRVLAKKFGAFLTFASLRHSEATAPGQPTIDDMKRLYRWDAIDRDTKVFGVVGSPIAHSLSPAVHNAAFEHESINAVYLPMLVNPGYESFKAFMESFRAFAPLDLAGLSITIPHKENALRYLRETGARMDDMSQTIGAVNTIAIERDPKSQISNLTSLNTDSDAILDTITSTMSITRDQLGDLRVAVIGAGGTGRTAVAALASCGATVVVYNRTREKADAVAHEFDGRIGKVVAARMEKLCDSCCHVFINATPIGMHPNVDASPLGDRLPNFTSDTLVFDTIYNPAKTKLLRQAEQTSARTVGGMEMFIRQAAAQFQAWTGRAAPVTVMRHSADERLSFTESGKNEK
jgi:3-dehydroquinate dehydratase/shikimate dehydrogenase